MLHRHMFRLSQRFELPSGMLGCRATGRGLRPANHRAGLQDLVTFSACTDWLKAAEASSTQRQIYLGNSGALPK